MKLHFILIIQCRNMNLFRTKSLNFMNSCIIAFKVGFWWNSVKAKKITCFFLWNFFFFWIIGLSSQITFNSQVNMPDYFAPLHSIRNFDQCGIFTSIHTCWIGSHVLHYFFMHKNYFFNFIPFSCAKKLRILVPVDKKRAWIPRRGWPWWVLLTCVGMPKKPVLNYLKTWKIKFQLVVKKEREWRDNLKFKVTKQYYPAGYEVDPERVWKQTTWCNLS